MQDLDTSLKSTPHVCVQVVASAQADQPPSMGGGQMSVLQASCFSWFPWQLRPPKRGLGCEQKRPKVKSPPPQVTVQGDMTIHSVHLPSARIKKSKLDQVVLIMLSGKKIGCCCDQPRQTRYLTKAIIFFMVEQWMKGDGIVYIF